MKNLLVAAVLASGLPNSHAAVAQPPRPFVVEDPPRSPKEQQKLFHLPRGFRIDLVAAEPDIVNPINLNFDAAGNLYVSQSIEYPIPDPIDQPGRDAIRRVVDSDGDGIVDTVSTFADELHIPIGVTPVPGGVLGFSIPRIYFFGDADEDGTAERRDVRFGEFGFADTHGMVSSLTWWIDGWVYGCHGFVNTSDVGGTEGEAITMVSGNTYRLLPDGSRIEHFAHGQVNPFGLTIDPWGNVFTSDCHTRPATMLLRGAHYPRSPGDGLGHGPELMQHSHGSTGIAGIVSYWADQFPEKYRGSLFIGNPITGCINQDRMERSGSTFRAIEQPDFLTCDDFWFRPVDLQLGPDGALYIADMYNCIIGHYEVPLMHEKRDRSHGRIWRVSYVGDDHRGEASSAAKSLTPNLQKASAEELIRLLAHANLVIRTHATHQLVERIGADAVTPTRRMLNGESTEAQRAHGLWVLKRLGELSFGDWSSLVKDVSPLVRLHALKALAEFPNWDQTHRDAALDRLTDEDAFVRRAAVDALGRHPDEASVEPLLRILAETDPADSSLIHTARMALRDSLHGGGGFPQLEAHYATKKDALYQLVDVAIGIPRPDAAAFLWNRFQQGEFPVDRAADVLRHIIRYSEESRLPEIDQIAKSYSTRDETTQVSVASALVQGAQERGIPVPDSILGWTTRMVRPLLASNDVADVRRGVELASQMRLMTLATEIVPLCRLDSPHPSQRLAAIQALMTIGSQEVVPLFVSIVSDANDIPALRQFAAEKLANRKELRERILEMLKTAPQDVAIGLARGLLIDHDGVVTLLHNVEQGKITSQVLRDAKVQRLLPLLGQSDDVAHFKELTADLPSLDQQVQQAINKQRLAFQQATPNVTRGAAVFRKACALCHRLDNEGERIGPELDGVGQRGIDRLLEDILDPNRTVDHNFRATIVTTRNGLVHSGLVTGQEGEVLLLADQLGTLHRIPLADIEERRLLNGSAMPANVNELLKAEELYDLLAFLLSKAAKPQAAAVPAGE